MQVLPDAVIINLSRAQSEILRNPKHSWYVQGIVIPDGSGRARIPVAEIPGIICRLRALQAAATNDSEYARRRPGEVVDRIILRIESAAAAQQRTYGMAKSGHYP